MAESTDPLRSRHIWFVSRDKISEDSLIAGRSDVAIRPSTRLTYEAIRGVLPELDESLLIRSPVRRAQQTCARLAPGREWELNDHLLPRDFGDWEGMSWGEVRDRDPMQSEAFWNDFAASEPPGGEALSDVRHRLDLFLTGLLNRDCWSDAISVTHPDVIRVAICLALDIKLSHALRVAVQPLTVTTLSHTWMGWQVDGLNVRP